MELKKQIRKIGTLKNNIGKKRDELRELHAELKDFMETVECGCDDLDDGLKLIEDGIDSLSQQI